MRIARLTNYSSAEMNKQIKSISLLMSLAMIAIYMSMPHQSALLLGLSSQSPPMTRITYMMVHANPTHLIVNIYAILSMAFVMGARLHHLIASLLISATIPSVLIADTPMLGISVANSALIGAIVFSFNKPSKWIVINLLFILIGAAIPGLAWKQHLYGFFAGLVYGFVTTPRYE